MNHFSESEFFCPCGCGNNYDAMDMEFTRRLDIARTWAKIPFVLTSSIRCKAHNVAVGGSEMSSHMKGCAVDIACENAYHRFKIFQSLLDVGFNRIGFGANFIHVDADGDKPKELLWTY